MRRPDDIMDLTVSDTEDQPTEAPTQHYPAAQDPAEQHAASDDDDQEQEKELTPEQKMQAILSERIASCHETLDRFHHHSSECTACCVLCARACPQHNTMTPVIRLIIV